MPFESERLSQIELEHLKELGRLCREDILKMTYLAGSGHPGGSMSSVDIYLVLFSFANIDPGNPFKEDRDRIVISHGHTSPGVYSALARVGFFPPEEVVATFRRIKSPYEGHITRGVPGIEWTTGNLGQGLSAGCGFALASRIKKIHNNTFVVMSDGEQGKGQVAEARRFAKKFALNDITVLIDYNRLQICGDVCEVMPVNFKGGFEADGWKTMEIDGHNYEMIYEAIRTAVMDKSAPYAIICHTLMGKGVDFMENNAEYHGRALRHDELISALLQLNPQKTKEDIERELAELEQRRKTIVVEGVNIPAPKIKLRLPHPKIYLPKDNEGRTKKIGCREAFGDFIYDLAKANEGDPNSTPIVAFDCDLLDSVKLTKFAKAFPQNFFESGVQEHNTATIAGALSTQNVLVFFADFGVFNIDETYNQHRLNDINHTNLRLISTHIGLDVGADGKTHHCIDYLGVIRNLYGFKVIIPADANETYQALLFIADKPGNWLIGVGRESLPIITKEDSPNEPLFNRFVYGKATLVRNGTDIAIISMGSALHLALSAFEILKAKGINAMLWNFSSPLEPDFEALKIAASTGIIVTVEDHNVRTGLGNIIANTLFELRLMPEFRKLGVTNYSFSASPQDLYKMECFDPQGIANEIENILLD